MVAEVRVQYKRRAEGYYVKDGKPTTELGTVRRKRNGHPLSGTPETWMAPDVSWPR